MIRRSKTANGDEWTLDESGYKTIDRNNIDADLKKLLQSLE